MASPGMEAEGRREAPIRIELSESELPFAALESAPHSKVRLLLWERRTAHLPRCHAASLGKLDTRCGHRPRTFVGSTTDISCITMLLPPPPRRRAIAAALEQAPAASPLDAIYLTLVSRYLAGSPRRGSQPPLTPASSMAPPYSSIWEWLAEQPEDVEELAAVLTEAAPKLRVPATAKQAPRLVGSTGSF